jgi:lipopolysaccharide export system ATP-binding protein
VDPHATDEIGQMIHHMADRGIGVLITDHKARELLGIVHRAYVIESGRVLAEGDVAEIVAHQDVRRVYLGEGFRL